MKQILTIVTTMLLVAFFTLGGCKEKNKKHKHAKHEMDSHAAHSKIKTKILKQDGLQFAFDLASMKDHMKMMKSMKMEMKHDMNATHALMLTILDLKSKKIVKGAEVSFSVTHADEESKTHKAHIMEGGGMYHYGADLKLGHAHKVKIIASVKSKDKSYSVSASFDLGH